MARSSSAKNGKNSKNTYRASGSKSSKSSSSGARHNSSASGSKKRMSRLEQRRAQQHCRCQQRQQDTLFCFHGGLLICGGAATPPLPLQ